MNSSAVSFADGWTKVTLYGIYMVQGSLVSLGNLLIVAAIARYEALRNNKEYVLILGLSLADCINMAVFFFAGVYRTLLLFNGTHDTQKSAWSCMLTVQNILWGVGMQLSGLMLTTVSLDRLCSVLVPLAYLGWTASYARRLVSSVYIFCFLHVIYIFSAAYGSSVTVPATCMYLDIVKKTASPYYYLYFNLAMPFYTVFSVVLYGVVMLVLKKRFDTLVFPEHPHKEYELKRQKKITMTLLFSALCTLFLFVIPFSVAIFFFAMNEYTVALFMWCFCNLNPAMNVLIYPLRHKEIRQALVALIKCKHMSADLKMWSPQIVIPAAEMTTKKVKYVPRGARVEDEIRGTMM